MDESFIGTKLKAADFRDFGIRAAEMGTSKSGLLRKLALEFLAAKTAQRAKQKAATK